MTKNTFFIVVFLFCSVLPSRAQWSLMTREADSLVQVGIDHIYNFRFDSASAVFDDITKSDPRHPVGYFLDAMIDWWRINAEIREPGDEERFLGKIDRVIRLCDTLLEANQTDIVGLFFKGGSIGYRARHYATRKEWVKAASDGKRAVDIVMQAWKIAPGNKDVLLGIGIYHYFAEAIPEQYPLIKPLMYFLPDGDKKSGISELKLAYKKARYAATEAGYALLQVYYQFENNFPDALDISKDLYEKYQGNAIFHRYVGRCQVRLGMTSSYEQTWRDVLIKCMDKLPGYEQKTAREAMFYIGMALFYKGSYADAKRYFYKCDEFSRFLDTDEVSGYMILLNLRLAYIYDVEGKRDLAIKQYNKILRWRDYQNSHSLAKQYIKKPYGR